MMSRDERRKLRDAAQAAVKSTYLRGDSAVRNASIVWQLQTSNSFRRIGCHGDGDVLCGTKHHRDGHSDLLAAPGVLAYIVAAQPRVMLALLDALEDLESEASKKDPR
jgi:hypothetical protein